jgi:hypothetical protein
MYWIHVYQGRAPLWDLVNTDTYIRIFGLYKWRRTFQVAVRLLVSQENLCNMALTG